MHRKKVNLLGLNSPLDQVRNIIPAVFKYNFLEVWDQTTQTIIYRMDKQQGPTE